MKEDTNKEPANYKGVMFIDKSYTVSHSITHQDAEFIYIDNNKAAFTIRFFEENVRDGVWVIVPKDSSLQNLIDGETLEAKVRNILSPIKNFITLSRSLLQEPLHEYKLSTEQRKLMQDCGLSADQHIDLLISEVHNYEKKRREEYPNNYEKSTE